MPPETSAFWPTLFNYGLTLLLAIIAWNVKDIIAGVKELRLEMNAANTKLELHNLRLKTLEGNHERE